MAPIKKPLRSQRLVIQYVLLSQMVTRVQKEWSQKVNSFPVTFTSSHTIWLLLFKLLSTQYTFGVVSFCLEARIEKSFSWQTN